MHTDSGSVGAVASHHAQEVYRGVVMPSVIDLDADDTLFRAEERANKVACSVANSMLTAHGKTRQYDDAEFVARFAGVAFRLSVQTVANENGFQLSPAEVAKWDREELQRNIESFRQYGVELAPGVVDAVKALRDDGYELQVVSSSHGDRLDACFESSGLDLVLPKARRFSAQSSLAEPLPKPNPAILDFAIQESGYAAEKHLGVEDSRSGVLTYAKANNGKGVPVVGFTGLVPASHLATRVEQLITEGVTYHFQEWRDFQGLLQAMQSGDQKELSRFRLRREQV